MVNIFDRFWVPQHDGTPDQNHLIILIAIQIVLIISIIAVHKTIRFRITNSMRGPVEDSTVIIPHILSESLSLIYWGTLSILISNIITFTSGIFGSMIGKESSYLLLGQEDFLWFIGLQFILIGLYNFFHELTREGKHDKIRFNPYLLLIGITFFVFLTMSFDQFFNQPISDRLLIVIPTIAFIVINLYLGVRMVTTRDKGRDNILIDLRKYLVMTGFFFTVIFILLIVTIFAPRPIQSTGQLYYPTRHSEASLFPFSGAIFTVILHILLLIIVYPPKKLRDILGISQKDFVKYSDYRFDDPFSFKRKIKEIEETEQWELETDMNYIITYNRYELNLAKSINNQYQGTVLNFKSLDEETLKKLVLPTSEIIFLDQEQSRISDSIFGILRRHYSIDVIFEGNKVVYGSYVEYDSDKYWYALIIMLPSYWNYKRKFWHISYDYKIREQISRFLREFKTYLEDIAIQNHISLMLLRFPDYDNRIGDIPPLMNNSDIPDPEYIHFFKSE